jgi:D-glycero-alpha-D-manno-heptose-7-phosphate kinase
MKKVIVRAPVRADLAGGTLDLWPLYLFHPGSRTVNVAISFYAESEVTETGESGIELHLSDAQYRQKYSSVQAMASDPKAALIYRLLEHFHLDGLRIVTRTDAPRGSGLGGSSALAITLARAFSEVAGQPIDGEALIQLVRDLETRLLGVPAGIQDYYPPVFGGLAALHLEPGAPVRHPISTPVHDLASHMLLHYTGIAHFSGTNNWELYKRQIDGDERVRKGFSAIAATAIDMERALNIGDFEAAGAALAAEWGHRKALIDGISTPEIESAISAALGAGAWGGKVCGAGGGGCIIFLFPPDRREAILHALQRVDGRVLDANAVPHGLTVDSTGEGQQVLFTRGRLMSRPTSTTLEQLYVHGESGAYHPYILAEGVVKHTESRSGIHHTVVHSYIAPIGSDDGTVLWHQASRIDPQDLDIRATPDPSRGLEFPLSADALTQSVAQAEDGFKQFLAETERLQVFFNTAFNLYSEANETREAFVERCVEEAERQISDQTERLESTFRRRIDQLRERSEREQRDIESHEDNVNVEPMPDMSVAWGRALYNITSGRPATTSDPSHSVRQVDYLENIAQIQRAWDRELQGIRDELLSSARSIEEMSIAPAARNIEVTKYLIIWAGDALDQKQD